MKKISKFTPMLLLVLVGCGDGAQGTNCSEAGPCGATGSDGGLDQIPIDTLLQVRSLDGGSKDLNATTPMDSLQLEPDTATTTITPAIDALAQDVEPSLDTRAEPRDVDPVADTRLSPDTLVVDAFRSADTASTSSADAMEALAPRATYLDAQAAGSTIFRDGASIGLLAGPAVPIWGEKDTLTGPTCLPGDYTSNGRSCTQYLSWGQGDALCLSGTVPAVPTAELGTSWGLGYQITVGRAGELGQDFTTVSANLTGVPASATKAGRFMLGVKTLNSDGTTTLYYHIDNGTGTAYPLTEFNTQWWDNTTGVFLKTEMVRHINYFHVLIASATSDSVTVTNLCLSQVTFN